MVFFWCVVFVIIGWGGCCGFDGEGFGLRV